MSETLTPAQQIKRITALKDCPAAMLILAKDEIRKSRIEKLLIDTFLKTSSSKANSANANALGLSKLDARDLDSSAIKRLKDDVFAMSLFSPKRFFLIHHVDELKAEEQKLFLSIIEKNKTDNKLIFAGSSLASNSSFKKFFINQDCLIELPEMEGPELRRWTEKELKTAGFAKYSEQVIELIISIAEESPDRIACVVEHLSLYADSDQAKVEDIHKVFVQHVAPGEFDFIDALALGHKAKAEVLLRNLLASGKNPFMLMSLISRTFATYLSIKALMAEGLNNNEIRQKLNIPPWAFNRQISACKNWSIDRLKRFLEGVLRADSKLKNYSLGAEAIFSELIHR